MEHLSSIWIVGTVASLFLIVCEVCLASGLKRCTLFVSCWRDRACSGGTYITSNYFAPIMISGAYFGLISSLFSVVCMGMMDVPSRMCVCVLQHMHSCFRGIEGWWMRCMWCVVSLVCFAGQLSRWEFKSVTSWGFSVCTFCQNINNTGRSSSGRAYVTRQRLVCLAACTLTLSLVEMQPGFTRKYTV